MVIQLRSSGGETVLSVRGEIVYGAAEALEKALAQLSAGTESLVVDMAQVTFMDSTGLQLLSRLGDFGRLYGIPVRTINWVGQARRVLELTGFDPDTPGAPAPVSVEQPPEPSAVALERAEALGRLGEEVDQLQHAMVSRPLIDQACGVLMAAESCTAEEAWGILRETSQHTNVKLRDIAAAVVAGVDGSGAEVSVRTALRKAVARSRVSRRREG
ncbi:ANTAR domain-containing protein [Streptomyces sp. NPDC048441]|uniref:ANTAR domain-containing protein n=1 Tax=Streptomyces sp. NPDC048441 TaxID=3365552 RepID=UPI0037124DCB